MGEEDPGGQYRSIQFWPKMTYLEAIARGSTGAEFGYFAIFNKIAKSLTTCSFFKNGTEFTRSKPLCYGKYFQALFRPKSAQK